MYVYKDIHSFLNKLGLSILIHVRHWAYKNMVPFFGLQSRNRETDAENKRMDTKGGKWGLGVG